MEATKNKTKTYCIILEKLIKGSPKNYPELSKVLRHVNMEDLKSIYGPYQHHLVTAGQKIASVGPYTVNIDSALHIHTLSVAEKLRDKFKYGNPKIIESRNVHKFLDSFYYRLVYKDKIIIATYDSYSDKYKEVSITKLTK